MRLTTSLFRRRALLAAPLAAVGPSTPAPRPRMTHAATEACYTIPPHDDGDTVLALSELQGQLARTQAACLRLAQELEARYVRYAWTEQLARELRAIAHDTPMGG
jgi:hypothetical protein